MSADSDAALLELQSTPARARLISTDLRSRPKHLLFLVRGTLSRHVSRRDVHYRISLPRECEAHAEFGESVFRAKSNAEPLISSLNIFAATTMVSKLLGREGSRKTATMQRQTALALFEGEREVMQLPVLSCFCRKLIEPGIKLLMRITI